MINLRNAHVDHDPDFARLLMGDAEGNNSGGGGWGGGGGVRMENVFAVYSTQNTFLFAARSEVQKLEWILKIDQSYFSASRGRGGGSPVPGRR